MKTINEKEIIIEEFFNQLILKIIKNKNPYNIQHKENCIIIKWIGNLTENIVYIPKSFKFILLSQSYNGKSYNIKKIKTSDLKFESFSKYI